MRAQRIAFAVLLIVCGFAAGLVVLGRMRTAGEADAQVPSTPRPSASAPAAPAPAAAPVVNASLPDFSRIAERSVPAVVNVSSRQVVRWRNAPFANDPFFGQLFGDPDDYFGSRRSVENSLGSGVIVSPDGFILTNNHVVTGESRRVSIRDIDISVALSDKREMGARVVGIDPSTDLALLKVDAQRLPTIAWGDSDRLKVAEWVLAIGNPYQLSETVTLGIVSAVNRRNVGINAYEDFIQTDAAINPGNSGGALINARGELVGINTAIFSQSGGYQGIGFAVASNLARRVQDDLQRYGKVQRGSIGFVEYVPLTDRLAAELGVADSSGIVVGRMRRDSSAYEGGLRPYDIVVSFGGTAVTGPAHLSRLIQDARIGSTVPVVAIREGRRIELRIPIRSTAG
jgi:Do/DeqQ family serine protease